MEHSKEILIGLIMTLAGLELRVYLTTGIKVHTAPPKISKAITSLSIGVPVLGGCFS